MESGLVVVAPVKEAKSSPWAFLKPFTIEMWAVTGAFFLFVGAIVWILEHRFNHEFRGPPRRQLITIFWLVSQFLTPSLSFTFRAYFSNLVLFFFIVAGLASRPCSSLIVSILLPSFFHFLFPENSRRLLDSQ